ncbi:MAG: hypothetical protein KAI24_10585, partial [Planctomycetes bacterium]|nr:hypothetical protein [Planctomycetota bacterium]
VADEVRKLAKRTAEQAATIDTTVAEVQSESDRSVLAVSEVQELVASVREHQREILEVVQQQDRTCSDVQDLVRAAARDSATIGEVCPSVDAGTERTRKLAGDTASLTAAVRETATQLEAQLRQFRW